MTRPDPPSPRGTSESERSLRRTQARLQQTILDLRMQLAARDRQIQELTGRLDEIQGSRAWKLVQGLWRLRLALAPQGSRRQRLWERLLGGKPTRPVTEDRSPEGGASRPAPGEPEPVDAEPAWIAWESEEPGQIFGFAGPEGRFAWPLISVLLPVYNHAGLLPLAVQSVLSSTYPRLELIVLDDGSSDAIEPVLAEIVKDPRVRVYRQPNQKLPRALTHAYACARGELITWTSADNLMAPEALQKLAEALLAHPEAVLAYADVAVIDEAGRPFVDGSYRPANLDPVRPDILRLPQDDLALGYEADNYINACFLYRRMAAEVLEGRFADDLRGLEDYDFWLRLQKLGRLIHIRNREPLYSYRVHAQTMSHSLLTDQRQAHLERLHLLAAYEAERRAFAQKRWTLVVDSVFSPAEKDWIAEVASALPVDLVWGEATRGAGKKALSILAGDTPCVEPVRLRLLPEAWRLEWLAEEGSGLRHVDFWRGVWITPLARKARSQRPNLQEIAQAGGRKVFGCHLRWSACPVDVEATRWLIRHHPQVLFLFVSAPGEGEPAAGPELVAGLGNAQYLGERAPGQDYGLYARFDALWLPPALGDLPAAAYREALALAYAIGRPLVIPDQAPIIPAPYQFTYNPLADALDFSRQLARAEMDFNILDGYLEAWLPAACLAEVLRAAGARLAVHEVPRPDFKIPAISRVAPIPWTGPARAAPAPIKVALLLDTLNKGGLEGVAAQLARHLPAWGVETFVVCGEAGGAVADRLRRAGIKVYITAGDPDRAAKVLEKEQPGLVHSHRAGIQYLEAAHRLGIPIVETIHNTYAWYQPEEWENEARRSQYFAIAVAVSQLVREYYVRRTPAFPEERMRVIPNGIALQTGVEVERQAAREKLGFSEADFIFLVLASYDLQKNHLGLLAAFDEAAARFPQAHLVCAGHPADERFYEAVRACRLELGAKDRIHLHGFRQDTDLLLAAADVFVLDSFFEGWSLAATEALLAGIPLIHSHAGSGKELVGEQGERGLLIPNPAGDPLELERDSIFEMAYRKSQPNTPDLVRAMARMITERGLWQSRKEAIRSQARAEFCLEKMLGRYAQVYREVFHKARETLA